MVSVMETYVKEINIHGDDPNALMVVDETELLSDRATQRQSFLERDNLSRW